MINISTTIYLKMMELGSKKVAEQFEYINELNVFPVPDGDTGTNMMMTIGNSYDQLSKQPGVSLNEFAKMFSRTLLMNARGNSGVIFTQIFRGFFAPIIADPEKTSIELSDMVICFKSAKVSAYSAVSNPIEGTMLTIIRVISEWLDENHAKYDSMFDLFQEIMNVGNKAVEDTTEMLPQLKEANLIDSGAFGLMLYIEGMYDVLSELDTQTDKSIPKQKIVRVAKKSPKTKRITYIDTLQRQEVSEEGFGYCCEFICQLNYILYADQEKKQTLDIDVLEKELLSIGNSLVKIIDDDLVKIHLHTFWPYKLFEIGQKYGEFLKIKVENMTQQYLSNHPEESIEEIFKKNKLTSKTKILITTPSNKLGRFFKKEFSISSFINTDQTGNPSIIDFTNKIRELKTNSLIIITDDVNIIMAAEQAIKLQDKKYNIILIKAHNPMEVLWSLFSYNPELNLLENKKLMTRGIESSKTGAISISSKSLKTNGVTIYKGDFIAIIKKDIVYSDQELIEVVKRLIKKLSAWRKSDFVNIIYGKDVNLNQIDIIQKFVNEQLNMKCKIIDGGQSIYHLYIGI